MASLQDQLLKAGIVDKKKAKEINKEKRKKAKKQPKGSVQLDETKEQAKRALADKVERDREINRQQQATAEQKAVHAQIIQLVNMNRISRQNGDIAYQFSDGKIIKKLYVTAELQSQLIKGKIAISKLGESFELVPSAIAEKIRQRDESIIVLQNSNEKSEVDEDDPYADYQIPDDLMW
ncbi:MAG: DUF2058 domain-containing protein [Halioglobus sp.]